jgi:nucleotide-binding universal stress UspA family protein
MFAHLLIPLDGSRLAESVLPLGASLARKLGSAVTLLHVIERDAPAAIHGDRHLTNAVEAEQYLEDLSRRYFGDTEEVELHVHTDVESNVARSIVDHARERASELVLLCTHGRGGLRHRLFGGIAQRVLRIGTVPVMLAPPAADAAAAEFQCRRVLVPLDGQAEHEQALPVATDLSRRCGAALHVLAVVPTFETLSGPKARSRQLLPGSTAAMLDLNEEDVAAYVKRLAETLRREGCEADVEVARGDPGSVIVGVAERTGTDLIVMGTHGKTGLDAFWEGSVAPRVAGRASKVLLLIPVGGVPTDT